MFCPPIPACKDGAMRKYAWLKKPYLTSDHIIVCRIMLYDTGEGVCLFLYSRPDDVRCVSDRFYDSPGTVYEEWNDLIDDRGWIGMDDPLPGCQHDAFIPLRVKGRDAGKPEWGRFETLRDGKWIEYIPE